MPTGAEFPVLVDAIIEAATGVFPMAEETRRQLRRLKNDIKLQVLVTTACVHSPAVAHAALHLALQSPRVQVEVIELAEFPEIAQAHSVRAVPVTVIEDRTVISGVLDESAMSQALLRVGEGRTLGDLRGGASTPFALPTQQQAQPRPALGSGLVLPR